MPNRSLNRLERVRLVCPIVVDWWLFASSQSLWVCLIVPGQAVNVLQLLPAHAAELAGRSARNLERLRMLDGAVIDVNPATNVVTIIADESSIVKVTVCVSVCCLLCVQSMCSPVCRIACCA